LPSPRSWREGGNAAAAFQKHPERISCWK
jgi:hypothetical protein